MKLIVGLGNPGARYLLTRHNIGFMALDVLANNSGPEAGASSKGGGEPALAGGLFVQKKHQSLMWKIQISGQPALLAKPQTFMNLSGQAVREIRDFYKIPLEDLLVIQDDKDLPFRGMKFQKGRGHGGHNGIKNIHGELKTNSYARLKLGIGASSPPPQAPQPPETDLRASWQPIDPLMQEPPETDLRQTAAGYVLSSFSGAETKALPDFLQKAAEAVLLFAAEGFEKAAGRFNQKEA